MRTRAPFQELRGRSSQFLPNPLCRGQTLTRTPRSALSARPDVTTSYRPGSRARRNFATPSSPNVPFSPECLMKADPQERAQSSCSDSRKTPRDGIRATHLSTRSAQSSFEAVCGGHGLLIHQGADADNLGHHDGGTDAHRRPGHLVADTETQLPLVPQRVRHQRRHLEVLPSSPPRMPGRRSP